MSNLVPEKMTYSALAEILGDITARVINGDSWEGNIEYMVDYEDESDPNMVLVRGAYRIGNRQGQGGMRMIGTVPSGQIPGP